MLNAPQTQVFHEVLEQGRVIGHLLHHPGPTEQEIALTMRSLTRFLTDLARLNDLSPAAVHKDRYGHTQRHTDSFEAQMVAKLPVEAKLRMATQYYHRGDQWAGWAAQANNDGIRRRDEDASCQRKLSPGAMVRCSARRARERWPRRCRASRVLRVRARAGGPVQR